MADIINKYSDMIYGNVLKRDVLVDGTIEEYNFLILNLGSHPTAYVEIPSNHCCYNLKSYDDFGIDVHGGVTYWSCHPVKRGGKDRWIGWDYAHFDDYISGSSPRHCLEGKQWSVDEILEDVKSVINQLKELAHE